jgi:hypothetical protein
MEKFMTLAKIRKIENRAKKCRLSSHRSMIYKTLHRKLKIEQRDSISRHGWSYVFRKRKQFFSL